MCLEFSKIDNELLNFLYKNYSKTIPTLGKYIAGSSKPYEYLIKSIDSFYNQEQLLELIKKWFYQRRIQKSFKWYFSYTFWMENLNVKKSF